MAALGGLLVAIGYAIGGVGGATGFLAIALLLNFVFYWFSDRIALASARAKPISESEAPQLYQMVRELTTRADLPMPKLYISPAISPTPSPPDATRATRRSPSPPGSPSSSPRTSSAE
jgi:heat shock protein HtpX